MALRAVSNGTGRVRESVRGGGGLPDLPAGFAYLVDSSGNYLVDSNGAYLIGAA